MKDMNKKGIVMIGIILLTLGFSLIEAAFASESTEDLIDDIPEYNGSIGPDNPFYGLRLALENWDESFTFNATEKLHKKVAHSRLRIAEAKAELKKKNSEAAQNAFEHYKEKIKETEASISEITENDSGILNAQKNIVKNQYVLEKLLESHPDNIGIQNAYNNSRELEDKFENKTEQHLERVRINEGKHIIKVTKKGDKGIKKEEAKQERQVIKEENKDGEQD
jgi:hypothetical protein